jgi:hypothetical protein
MGAALIHHLSLRKIVAFTPESMAPYLRDPPVPEAGPASVPKDSKARHMAAARSPSAERLAGPESLPIDEGVLRTWQLEDAERLLAAIRDAPDAYRGWLRSIQRETDPADRLHADRLVRAFVTLRAMRSALPDSIGYVLTAPEGDRIECAIDLCRAEPDGTFVIKVFPDPVARRPEHAAQAVAVIRAMAMDQLGARCFEVAMDPGAERAD